MTTELYKVRHSWELPQFMSPADRARLLTMEQKHLTEVIQRIQEIEAVEESPDAVMRFLKAVKESNILGSLESPRTTADQRTQVIADSFLAECEYKGLSPATSSYYRSIVNRFAQHFPLWPTKSEGLEGYLGHFAPRNRLNHYNVLAIFFRFGARRHHLPNPMIDVTKPKVKEEPLPTLYPEQAKEVEANLVDDKESAIFALGYGMGWRLSEITRGKFADIGSDTMVVHGKERDETVPLMPEIKQRLLALRNGRSLESPIFWGQRGPLGKHAIWKIIKQMLARVGVEGSPHTLRHGYGTALALQGCDAHTIMRLMRHKKINQAIVYINMTDRHLADRQRAYCPLDMVKTGNKNVLSFKRWN